MHQRDTSGLKEHAQNKRRQTFERVENGIQQLVREGRPINFATVSEVSGVSRAWLNKEPEIQKRIQFLRNQQTPKKGVPPSQKASDASNAAKVRTLLQEVKKLRAENHGLRLHIEEILGRLVYADEEAERCRKEVELLKAKKTKLENELSQIQLLHTTQPIQPTNLSSKASATEGSKTDKIQAEISKLGIKLNPTLTMTIESASEETVLTALEALKEALADGAIKKNPAGWLKRAIEGAWQPNGSYIQTDDTSDRRLFNKWFPLARARGLVIASTKGEKEIQVLMSDEQWISFTEALAQYPIEILE